MKMCRLLLSSVLFAGILVFMPGRLSAQCGSTVAGTVGNPYPLNLANNEAGCSSTQVTVQANTSSHDTDVNPRGCGAGAQRAQWFVFTATSTETVISLSNNSSSNTGFMVYSGPCGTTMNLIGCAGYIYSSRYPNLQGIFPTVPGTQYYVRVSRASSNSLSSGMRLCAWNLNRPPDYDFCDDNGSFERGDATGWRCRYGNYGAPAPFAMRFPNPDGCLNPSGRNAPLAPDDGGNQAWNGGNRHTIMSDKIYLDPRTNFKVSGVAPGGGNYSFRLGNNDKGCGVAGGTPCPSQAESISLPLLVTRQNAGFTYMFSAVMDNPGHAPDEQPRFEALVTDANGTTLNCGYFLFVAGSGLAQFRSGARGWQYTEWMEVGLDLTAYIGQTVTIEFRTSSCYPGSGGGSCSCSGNNCRTTTSSGGVNYTCTNVTSCNPADPANNPNCQAEGSSNNNAGTHSAYAYIDAYCKPLEVDPPEFCAGASSIEICAPPGYRNYRWTNDAQGRLQAPLNQRCVTVNNPEPGTRYRVDMELITGCPTHIFVELLGIPVTLTNDTTICPGQSVRLEVDVINQTAPPYTHQWSHGLVGPGPHTVTPAVTTTYTVTTTNASGCSSSRNITVTIGTCVHTVSTTGGATCPGGCVDISAQHTPGPSGAIQPYSYAWSHGPSGPGPHQVCPAATTEYTVTVTDGNGATATATVTAVVHPQPTVTATHTNTLCFAGSDGTTTAVPAGGTPPFTYEWSTTPPQTGATANGLEAGLYTVTITDANGCTATATATVGEPPELLPTTSTTPADCGAADGTATVTPVGGTGPYTYSWNTTPPQTTTTATGLIGGGYDVTVTDANGCSRTVTAIVGQTGVADLSTTQVDVTCNGGNDGSATVTATGGNPPFAYSWNTTPPQTGTTANNLTAGIWTVSVTDSIGCVTTIQVTIAEPTAIVPTASTVPANCGQSNGTTNVSATGGTPPYTYAWNTTPPQNTPAASAVPAGTYTVTITDAAGCTTTASATVDDIPGPTADFNFTDVCLGSPVGFNDNSSGQSPITRDWDLGDGSTSTDINPTHLYPGVGTYTVVLTVADTAGCTATRSRDVTIHPIPEVDFTADPTEGCAPVNTLFINLHAPPGGSCLWTFGDGTSSTDCNGTTHSHPRAGCYDVGLTVTSAFGCANSLRRDSLVCVTPIPVADFTISPERVPDTRPFVSFLNGSHGATRYYWEFLDGSITSTQRDPVLDLTGVDPGMYNACLWAWNDYGCVDSTCRVFRITTDLLVYVPNAFTPDGDGTNELFIPIVTGHSFDEYEFMVFNRWGELIFETNNPTMGWNGTHKGVMSQTGVYVWKLKVKPEEGTSNREFVGHVSLLR